jgi:hypothetical protein
MKKVIFAEITIPVSRETIENLLVSAFEGGSNYWYDDLEPLKKTSKRREASDRFYSDIMTNGFRLKDKETGKVLTRGPGSLSLGLQVMAKSQPRHFVDVTGETGDATTGDVFLQCCVFGEVIYG